MAREYFLKNCISIGLSGSSLVYDDWACLGDSQGGFSSILNTPVLNCSLKLWYHIFINSSFQRTEGKCIPGSLQGQYNCDVVCKQILTPPDRKLMKWRVTESFPRTWLFVSSRQKGIRQRGTGILSYTSRSWVLLVWGCTDVNETVDSDYSN
jgi:hypothetical protein